MERTLSIIKPDGVQRSLIGEVVKLLEQNELENRRYEDAAYDQDARPKVFMPYIVKGLFLRA